MRNEFLTKLIQGPDYTCAMEENLTLSIMKYDDGSATFIRLVDTNYPNGVKVFVVKLQDIEKIAGDLIQL